MENEIKVGDWIRTKAGQIHRVNKIIPVYENDKLLYEQQFICWDGKISGYRIWQLEDIIVKHSPNIIDLIQCGDYVNGIKIISIIQQTDTMKTISLCGFDNDYLDIKLNNRDIKTVVTKEMMESISYKVTKM